VQIDEPAPASLSMLVTQWIEAFNRHDVAMIVALYAGDAELFDAGMKRVRHGRQEIKDWFEKRFRTMPSISYIPMSQLFAENQAAVYWTSRGRTPRLLGQSWLSRPFQVDGMSLFTIQDGLIAKQRGFYDHLSVVEQALPPLKWLLPVRL
jgi:steroid delta-isomerase-like uncharacterized protein